jgi:excisionase family DNA binding protein
MNAREHPDHQSVPLLVTTEQAARTLAIGRSKLYELLSSGQLESVRIGGCRRIDIESLTRFIDEHRSRTS